jgi:hypothetical protein
MIFYFFRGFVLITQFLNFDYTKNNQNFLLKNFLIGNGFQFFMFIDEEFFLFYTAHRIIFLLQNNIPVKKTFTHRESCETL